MFAANNQIPERPLLSIIKSHLPFYMKMIKKTLLKMHVVLLYGIHNAFKSKLVVDKTERNRATA